MNDQEIDQEVIDVLAEITNSINGRQIECVIIALCEMIVSIHENSDSELQQYISVVADGMQSMISPKPANQLN